MLLYMRKSGAGSVSPTTGAPSPDSTGQSLRATPSARSDVAGLPRERLRATAVRAVDRVRMLARPSLRGAVARGEDWWRRTRKLLFEPAVARVEQAQWQKLRAVRLSALQDSPKAFVADFVEESEIDENEWIERIVKSVWVMARSPLIRGGRWIGVARLVRDDPGMYFIESVWLHEKWRGKGLVADLLRLLEEDVRDAGSVEVSLWVLQSNQAAWKAYRKLGFRARGYKQPSEKLRSNGIRVTERLMTKKLV
jgi:ribosomal protein S18 acetylase RimI-like enzyme